MNAKCQDSGATCSDRHPAIFARVKGLVNGAAPTSTKVLSFGCSTGEEPRSLKRIGEGKWEVHGAEIQEALLAKAREADPLGIYVNDASVLPKEHYDLVFCMSVLCRYRAPPTDFPFAVFESVLGLIVSLMKPGGLLVLYNAQYDARETQVGREQLIPIENDEEAGGSGFVPKFLPDMTAEIPHDVADAVPYLFRKRSSSHEGAELGAPSGQPV